MPYGSEERVRLREQRAVVEVLRGGAGLTRGGPSLRLGFACGSATPLSLRGVEAFLHLFLVAGVVQFEETVKDLDLDVRRDGEANALRRGVKSVLEIEIKPAVRLGDSLVHLDVCLPDCLDIRSGLGLGVDEVVQEVSPTLRLAMAFC